MSIVEQRIWREMTKRSWSPLDFGETSNRTDGGFREEGRTMFVWRKMTVRGEQVFQTGYWTPDKEWVDDKNFLTSDEAAARVRWLNGGN